MQPPQARLQVLRQHLTHGHACAQAHGIAHHTATALAHAFGQFGNGLGGLVLHELGHVVAHHAHADFLVENFLQLFGQRQVLYRQVFQLQAQGLKRRAQLPRQRIGKGHLVGGEIKKSHAAAGNGGADVLQHQAAQLTVEVAGRVAGAGARNFGVKALGVGHAVGVVAKSTQAHGAKVGVADGDGLGRAPFLVDLLACAEKVHIALEGRFKELVPVFQVGEHRQRLRGQLVGAGAKNVGHLAFIDEHRHLRLAHHQRGTVLDFHLRHRKAPGQGAIALLGPLQDVNELLLDEVHQGHGVRSGSVEKGKGHHTEGQHRGCTLSQR